MHQYVNTGSSSPTHVLLIAARRRPDGGIAQRHLTFATLFEHKTRAHADYWWVEVDQSTESPPRLRAKARTYRYFLTSGGVGPDGVPPRVLFTAPDTEHAQAITHAVTTNPSAGDGELITVTTHHHAAQFMIEELTTT